MFTLGARLDPRQTLGDGKINGAVIAQFKMQTGMIFDCAPIAAKQRVASDKIQCACNGLPIAQGQHQLDVVAHMGLCLIKKVTCEIGRAPFARARILIKLPKCIPMRGRDGIARQRNNITAKACGRVALFADSFAFERG